MKTRGAFQVSIALCVAVIALGEFVFPSIAGAATAPPATHTDETHAKIKSQRRKIAAVPVPAKLQRRTLKVGEVGREFFIHIPHTCKGKASPLVFVLHGGSASSGLAMHLKVDCTPVADRERLVVVYPSGTEGWNNSVAHKCTGGANTLSGAIRPRSTSASSRSPWIPLSRENAEQSNAHPPEHEPRIRPHAKHLLMSTGNIVYHHNLLSK